MTMMDVPTLDDHRAGATRLIRRKTWIALAVPSVILVYFVYVFFAFDIGGLAGKVRGDNAMTLIRDVYSHKVQVTRDNRSDVLTVSKEGDRKGRFPEGMLPNWVTVDGTALNIELEDGHRVTYGPDNTASYFAPDYGTMDFRVSRSSGVELLSQPDGPLPDWVSMSRARLDIRTDAGRLTMTRARTETFRYFFGWELFWVALDSPYYDVGIAQILFGPQLDPDRSNLTGVVQDFWNNDVWRHKDVIWALGETIMMAFLGTMGAAIIALPFAFLAAKNFTPLGTVRFVVRRVFDFMRGVDALIFTVLLSRAFGPGPLTGALAILLTDTGTFGKIFSEALENVDDKQIEGVASTGANPVQRYRFGVIPQIVPVLLSQILYFLESNTRSATIIGAITGGGIGLLLTQAIQTQKDWEEVAYYITLIIVMVVLMDWFSGWLRGKLIGRKD